jgi:hypothetical protein
VNLVCHLKQFSKRYKLFLLEFIFQGRARALLICRWNEEPLRTHIRWTELGKLRGESSHIIPFNVRRKSGHQIYYLYSCKKDSSPSTSAAKDTYGQVKISQKVLPGVEPGLQESESWVLTITLQNHDIMSVLCKFEVFYAH